MPKTFTYGAIHRPVSGIGHAPAGFIAFGDHPDFKFGTVSYDQPLSREEQEHYSLVDLSKSNAEIANEVAQDMNEYAAEYLEEAAESPRHFEAAVGQRLDRMNVHAKRDVIAPLVLRILRGESIASSAPSAHIAPARSVRAPRARSPRKVRGGFKAKGGEWLKLGDGDSAVLHMEDHKGRSWGVTADRDGSWRMRNHPLSHDDDERAYTEGHVDPDDLLPNRERFTAAKKAARSYLATLLETIAEEGN